MAEPTRIVALISGGGTTVLNVLDAVDRGLLDARVELVISSRADAAGLARCAARGVRTAVVPSRDFRGVDGPDWPRMSEAITEALLPADPDLVILAGYMCFYQVPEAYVGRVMNIHPALIPSFCGRGMFGHHVHESVVAQGVKVTGCTVHFVDNAYDHGPIIVQRTCPVFDTDTPDDVAARVFKEECLAYPEAIRLFTEKRLSVRNGIVRIAPEVGIC